MEDPSSCQEVLDKILSLAKGQLISVSSKSFLVDKILVTSSKNACRETFEDMYFTIFALCTADELRSRKREAIPMSWHMLLAALKDMSQTTVDQVIQLLQEIKSKHRGTPSIPKDVLESLESFRAVLTYLTEENDSKSKEEVASPAVSTNLLSGLSPEDTLKELENIVPTPSESDSDSDTESIQLTKNEELGAIPTTDTCPDESLREETVTAIDFLKGNGELLFYPNNPDLCKTLITRPMDLVRSLREVVNKKRFFLQSD